jgi:hypothetical protein
VWCARSCFVWRRACLVGVPERVLRRPQVWVSARRLLFDSPVAVRLVSGASVPVCDCSDVEWCVQVGSMSLRAPGWIVVTLVEVCGVVWWRPTFACAQTHIAPPLLLVCLLAPCRWGMYTRCRHVQDAWSFVVACLLWRRLRLCVSFACFSLPSGVQGCHATLGSRWYWSVQTLFAILAGAAMFTCC